MFVYNGKEYGFKFTPLALKEISKVCPEGNIMKIGKLIESEDVDLIAFTDLVAVMGSSMSKSYIMDQMLNSPKMTAEIKREDYNELTYEMIMLMSYDQLAELSSEVFDCFYKDMETVIRLGSSAGDEKKTEILRKFNITTPGSSTLDSVSE